MDLVGMIKNSYRGYGSLFSDKFKETFLKEDSRNVSSQFILICCCCKLNFLKRFSTTTGLDSNQHNHPHHNHHPGRVPVAEEQTSQ